MRKRAPFTVPQVTKLMGELAYQGGETVVLEVGYRHSVASRLWWTLSWKEEDGRTYSVSAQEWDLCFWRAIQVYKQNERRRHLEEYPNGTTLLPAATFTDGGGI